MRTTQQTPMAPPSFQSPHAATNPTVNEQSKVFQSPPPASTTSSRNVCQNMSNIHPNQQQKQHRDNHLNNITAHAAGQPFSSPDPAVTT